jgi:biopolymer transport protein ExbB
LVCSVIATALIIERLYQLRAQRVIPSSLLVEVLDKVDAGLPSSIDVDQLERGSPLGSILSATLRAFSANPKAQELELKQEIELEGRIIAHQLDRYLAALATIASAAPLLGLFGTVVGMIDIFGSQSGTSSNPAQLAHGISTALYNTAFGLIIAIPSLIFWRYFRTQIDYFVLTLESSSEKLLKHLLKMR